MNLGQNELLFFSSAFVMVWKKKQKKSRSFHCFKLFTHFVQVQAVVLVQQWLQRSELPLDLKTHFLFYSTAENKCLWRLTGDSNRGWIWLGYSHRVSFTGNNLPTWKIIIGSISLLVLLMNNWLTAKAQTAKNRLVSFILRIFLFFDWL